MNQRARRSIGMVLLTVGLAACGSSGGAADGPTTAPAASTTTTGLAVTTTTTTVPTADYGDAAVTPSTAAAGQRVTLTPAETVQPLCTDLATVWRSTPSGLESVAILSTDGRWQDGRPGATTTMPACAPAPTDAPATYVVPAELPAGTWVLCRTQTPTPAGCGTFMKT